MDFSKLGKILSDALRARRQRKASEGDERERETAEIVERLQRMRRTALDEDGYNDVELTGRGASHDAQEWQAVETNRKLVESSNVHSFYYSPETPNKGIVYVTFLYWQPGMKSDERSGPGQTYAYYDVPLAKYKAFEGATAESAGRAVWDYFRVRGTIHGHQGPYSLVQAEGEYVSRKATRKGFAKRNLLPPGVSPRDRKAFPLTRTSSLPARKFMNGAPNRGTPNRGTPNRGRP
jgi:hypothetical protein